MSGFGARWRSSLCNCCIIAYLEGLLVYSSSLLPKNVMLIVHPSSAVAPGDALPNLHYCEPLIRWALTWICKVWIICIISSLHSVDQVAILVLQQHDTSPFLGPENFICLHKFDGHNDMRRHNMDEFVWGASLFSVCSVPISPRTELLSRGEELSALIKLFSTWSFDLWTVSKGVSTYCERCSYVPN